MQIVINANTNQIPSINVTAYEYVHDSKAVPELVMIL